MGGHLHDCAGKGLTPKQLADDLTVALTARPQGLSEPVLMALMRACDSAPPALVALARVDRLSRKPEQALKAMRGMLRRIGAKERNGVWVLPPQGRSAGRKAL